MVTSPAVSWLFFKAQAKRPYLSHTGRASNAEKQPTGPGPEGCIENGPAAALFVGYVSIQICVLLPPVRLGPPCRRPILNATMSSLFARRRTRPPNGKGGLSYSELEPYLFVLPAVLFLVAFLIYPIIFN